MQKVKKICLRITPGRIATTILLAVSAVNMVIVGTAFEITSNAFPTLTTIPPADPSLIATPAVSETLITASVTALPTQTAVPTLTSTPSETSSPTITLTPSSTACVPRSDWFIYIVQPGDNLFRTAINTGSSVDELKQANCLVSDRIYVGQRLYVPRLPVTQTPSNTPVPPPPDIVVTDFRVTGSAEILPGQKRITLPIYVVIQNQGGIDADTFKLSVQYSTSDLASGGKFVVPFMVEGQADAWYPYTTGPLGRGGTVAFRGSIMFPESLQGQTIMLSILADSCAGDEYMPPYCRVFEGNEGNNDAELIGIRLPSNRPPNVTITSPEFGTSYIYDGYDQKIGYWYKDQVVLIGYVVDAEDGVLDGSSLAWTTDRTDVYKDPILGYGASLTLTLYSDDCTGHTITLTARDGDGNVTTATRAINISCPLN